MTDPEDAHPLLPDEPQPTSAAPPGLLPPPGLGPSPGLTPPSFGPPPGLTMPPGMDSPGPGAAPALPEAPAMPTLTSADPSFLAVDPELQPAVTAPPEVPVAPPHPEPVRADFAQSNPAPAQQATASSTPAPPAPAPSALAAPVPAQPGPSTSPAPGPPVSPAAPAAWSPPPNAAKPLAHPGAKGTGKAGWGALIGLGIVAIFLVIGFASSNGDPSDEAPSDLQLSASDAAVSYLTALANGDGTAARELAGVDGLEPLLTDEALRDAIDAAPITDIAVLDERDSDDLGDRVVTVAYEVGDVAVTREFSFWESPDSWLMTNGTVHLYTGAFEGMDLRIGGAAPEDSALEGFPIAYPVELTSDWFELSTGTDRLVLADDSALTEFSAATPVLSDAGVAEFRRLVTASLTECLAAQTLETSCGMSVQRTFSEGWSAVDGTVTRTLQAGVDDRLAAMIPDPDYGTPTRVTTYEWIAADIALDVSRSGEVARADLEYGEEALQPYVDFSSASPTLTWE